MPDSPFAINHFLKSKGLSGLDQAGAMMSQIGHLVRDHAHFKSLLNACEPAERQNMYEALSSSLRFKPKALWEYVLELSTEAEARQLPTLGEGGTLLPFKVAEIQTVSDRAADALAKEHLILVCAKCTREQFFHGMTRQECVMSARKAGWKQRKRIDKDGNVIRDAGCPQCTTTKRQTQN